MVKIVALFASLLLLSGCVSAAQAAPVEARPVVHAVGERAEKVAVPTLSASERAYVATIRTLIADEPHEEQDDATLVQGGRDVCAQIKDGATWDTFDEQIRQFDLDRGLYRSAISAAVAAFCPARASGL